MLTTLLLTAALAAEAPAPDFEGTHGPLPEVVKKRVVGSSWKEGCPVPIDGLAYLKVKHWGYDGKIHDGEIIVNAAVAAEVLQILRELYEAEFPIEKMRLVDHYGASDDKSMEDNNTSAFNCRWVTGKKGVFSKHSYGRAIDVNPKTNPYVTKKVVEPKGGAAYVDRTKDYVGGIKKGDACYAAFAKRGWSWGGNWRSLKDYQHFEKKK